MFRLTAPSLLIATACLFACCSSGCASSGSQRASKESAAAAAFGDFRESLIETRHAVDDSVKAIDHLAAGSKHGSADVAFNNFLDAYFRIVGKNAELAERISVMRDAGYEYFVVTAGPRLSKSRAKELDVEAQRTQTRIVFERLQQRLSDVRESLSSYRSDLSGVYNYLNRNLTSEQIASASNRFGTARQDADDVSTKLDSLLSEVRDLGTAAGITDKK